MNTFTLEKFDDEGNVCTFYTVRWEDAALSETDKFFDKYGKNPIFKQPIQELADFLTRKIGDEIGALEDFFKFENTAQALPPAGKHIIDEITINYSDFPLRLYCLRISDTLVILFNGGEKTADTAQGGKTSMVFSEANQFAKRILKALQDKDIYITATGRDFLDYTNSEDILL